MRYLLDSNICVYAMKNRPLQVLRRLQNVGPAVVAVSVITVLELRQGAEGDIEPGGLLADLCERRINNLIGEIHARGS